MQQWPKISIITPSYNQGAFLEQTICSVLEQNYPNLEYIVIDGGSTDNSVEIIKKHADKLSYWCSKKDNGQTDALNTGFQRATGDIVAWLNSDDEYCPGALDAIAKAFMADDKIDFVFGNKFAIDQNGIILRKEKHTKLNFTALVILGSTLSQCASFWKRSLFEQYGYLDDTLRFCMDYEFFCRIGQNIKAQHIRRYIAKFRWHSESKSSNIEDVRLEEHAKIRSKYLKAVCMGLPIFLIYIWVFMYRTFWYIVQGDWVYVLRGIFRRMLPKYLRPPNL